MRLGLLYTILRWIVGATFLFSGLAKGVDPVGTAIYVDKYLATYSLEAMLPLSEGIAVLLSTFETLLGVLLIAGVFQRLTSLVSLVLVSIFSVVTFVSATVLPIGDCGCFGDILTLTPWQTFLKNIYLLLLCYFVWRGCREQQRFTVRDFVILVVGCAIPLAVNLYALRHLPIVDSLPYKVGTSLYDDVSQEREREAQAVHNVLIFRDLTTGDMVEFAATEGACWEDANLEFVEAATRISSEESIYGDFRLYDANGEDCTLDVIGRRGRVALLCINSVSDMDDSHLRGLDMLLESYPKHGVVVLTAVDLGSVEGVVRGCDIYFVDAMTLRSVIRSDVGVVVLHDGVVEFKSDIRDI